MTLRRILSAVFVPLFIFMAVVFPMEKSYATGSLDLVPDPSILEEKVGKQTDSGPCAAYCLAYAKTIIDGQKHNPKEYWSTPTSGSVVWGKGKYSHPKDNIYNNSSALLKDVYNELKAGRLPIIYVTLKYTKSEYPMHYALVVGYQNVTDPNSLTENNFIVIDTNQPGVLKTLGDTRYGSDGSLILGSVLKAAYSPDTVHKHSYTGPYKNDTEHWWQCSCGAKAKIAAHTFGDWTITKGASTTETGTKTRRCSGCGYEQTAVIPVLTFTHTNAKVKMNYPVNIKKTPYASGDSVYQCTVGETFDIGAYGLNSYGNVWYQILNGPYAGNYIYSGETELVKYVNDLSITINNQIPTNIVQGTACQPSEIIKSRHNITNVTGAIYSDGTPPKLIYSGSVSPNVHDSYSTANTAITEALKFHLLAPGEYIYVVTATATTSLDFQAKGSANGTGITCLESKTFKETLYSKGFTVSAAPHEHTYGDWSKDGTNHWHECTDANCTDKVGSIKDTAAHVYDNDADTDCNVCGYVRSITPPAHEHTYGDWSKDGTNHWHECTDANCTDKVGSIKDKTEHVYDDDADTDCNVCGYVRSITPPAHEHTYGDWSKDGTNHWHECTDANCTDKVGSIKDTAAHVYDNDADTDCNVCGYVRSITPPAHEHTYGDWSKDGTNHWHECTDANCTDKVGSIKDTAAHVYDNDADTDCNVCGYVRSITPPAHEHTYGDWSKDGTNHWHECTDANCTDKVGSIKDTAAHVYDNDADTDCNVCGYVRSITPPAHEHTYGDWSKDGTSHWHECTCGDKADMAAHSFRWIIDRAATATQKGSKHEECTVCGYRRAAVEIPATGTTTGGTTGTPGGGHGHYHPTTTPVPVIVIPPKTGDMTIWQSILHFLGIR